jgi:large subunit ribosomal protein L15
VRLYELEQLGQDTVDLGILKAAGIVPVLATGAKVILAGAITRAVKLHGVKATKGARAAIEAAGGTVAEA